MERIDMNKFAVGVALEEDGESEINIAEIKQILRITMEKLGNFSESQILELISRYSKWGRYVR